MRGLPVSDEAVTLRPLAAADRVLFARAREDPTITGRFGAQAAEIDDQIAHFIGVFEAGAGGALAISPHGQPAVGAVFLEEGGPGIGNAGYWVLAEHRGHGYAARGLRLAARWALGTVGWERIQLWIEPDNEASLRVAQTAGFTREGVLRSWSVIDGRRADAVFFSLLPADLG